MTLVYVHVVGQKPAADSGAVADAAARSYAVNRLTALRDELRVGAHVSSLDARSAPRGLHEFAANRHADLIVVGASRRDPVGRDLLGDDTRQVLEDAPCPVAVAPAGYSAATFGVRRIGVAYNGSRESEQALALARKLAAERQATVSAFEAVPAPLYVHDPQNAEGEIDEDVQEARQRIAALGEVEPHAEFDDDAVEGLRRFGTSVDVLVVGSHRYGPVGRVLEQSTSQRLADIAPCPLLVLPSSRRETDPEG